MMRVFKSIVALGVGLAALPAGAQAIDPDVRCLLVSNLFAQAEKDPAGKQMAAVSGVYYFGRVDARLSLPQVRTQMMALSKGVKQAELPVIMNACAKQMQAKQQAFQAMGKAMAAAAAPAPGGVRPK